MDATNPTKSIRIIVITCVILLIIYLPLFSIKNVENRLFLKIRSGATFTFLSAPRMNQFQCSLRGEKWIVITTIFYPTPAIHKFLSLTTPWNLIVIADRKTPKDWLERLTINSNRLLFVSFDEQRNLDFRILQYLPQGSYARKNLGYLLAIKCGAKIIFESDDDNLLDTNDVYLLPKVLQPKQLPWIAFHRQRSPFINIYGSFGHPQIWPRGFPIEELRNVTEDGWHSVRRNVDNNTNVYIQQYLADLDPDVDAIYRLAYPLSIGRIRFDRDQPPIALQPFTFSPYNTQNTVTYYEAFWGLYLPVTTTFRVCDIWRGYWVQRLLWDIGGRLLFGTATMKQVRNGHSYIKDMDDENQLYHQSGSFVRFLASWSSSHLTLVERIRQLARDIVEAGFWQSKEAKIMEAWLADLQSVGYVFPSIVQSSSPTSITKKRVAVCVTGLAECVREAWVPTYDTLRKKLSSEMDTFLLLSSSSPKRESVPLDIRLKQIRLYMDSTVTLLYEDQVIDPRIPSSCKTFYKPDINIAHEINYFQQIWALNECYDLIKEYEKTMNVQYEFIVRSRPDSILKYTGTTLPLPNNSTISIPDEDHFSGYNDRFAIGPAALMETYMQRWQDLHKCYVKNIHAESFLKSSLNRRGIQVQLVKNLTYEQQRHGRDQCH